jgi:hypothetical protein
MIRSLVQHHGIHPGFLEIPLSFSYRSTDEEQGFSVPWTLIEDESKFGMLCHIVSVPRADKVGQKYSILSDIPSSKETRMSHGC